MLTCILFLVTSVVELVSIYIRYTKLSISIRKPQIYNFPFLIPGHIDDIFPYFMRHAKQIFPMLDCMDDLRKISDLRVPANWYWEFHTQILQMSHLHFLKFSCTILWISHYMYYFFYQYNLLNMINVCYRYPEARAIQRKIVFHAGPTNSGKTYHAIQRFLAAKSGVYCGPLKLLAHEIYEKSNDAVSFIPQTRLFWFLM